MNSLSNQFCVEIIELLTVIPVLEHGIVIFVGLPKKLSLTCEVSGKNLNVKLEKSRRQNTGFNTRDRQILQYFGIPI